MSQNITIELDIVLPRICLNMIVKNESRIIERLLKSVLPYIDTYLICDTGSTDNTKDIINRFFAVNNITGKIIDEPFRDFGYNRTVAMKACDEMEADYILLLDADMVFWSSVSPVQFRQCLVTESELDDRVNSFHILQGTDIFYYKNMRIVKNRAGFTYWGVTHEYVQCPILSQQAGLDKDIVFIKDIGDGGSKTDKFLRDIRLLTKGLEDNPNNDRYTFYLANSLKDAGQTDNAIEMYKKRIEIGGWIEEIWFSCYAIGKCYQSKGDMVQAIYWWLEAYNKYPCRIENIYQIVKHYRIQGNQNLAYSFYALADYERKTHTKWEEYLFLERGVYDFKLDYEMSILGYYCNRDKHDMPKICMKVLGFYGGEDSTYKNVLSNYKFYSPMLIVYSLPIIQSNLDLLLSVGVGVGDTQFYKSTPSITLDNNKNMVICQRYVNYKIDDKGGYVNAEHIQTRNIIAIISGIDTSEWRKIDEYEMAYNRELDDHYIGIEDVRIMSSTDIQGNNVILFNGNRGLNSGKMRIIHGAVTRDSFESHGIVNYVNSVDIEKNWVLFANTDKGVKCIYKWNPLTIGMMETNIDNTYSLSNTSEQAMPNVFNYVRGSTNGVVIDDEIWFITHLVSYEDRRYYYHMVVILDLATMRLKRYTKLFTFEKKPVEYTLGFVYMTRSRQILIGYSLLDRETKYIKVDRHILESLMV